MPASVQRRRAALALLFLVAFGGFLALLSSFPVLFDADSYFQLAVARSYAEEGLRRGLPWARFSLLREGFGDKDVLFHLLLVPFADWMDPLFGGRVAVALLNAALVTVLAHGALRVTGWWGLLVPLWVYVGAAPLFFRTSRLRPETFALLLLLAAAFAAARGRHRLLGLIALAFALSYTAIQALLGLCLLWMVAEGWRTGRWQPRAVLYPLLGAGLGLLIHPQFPANLEVWAYVNLLLPLHGAGLDVGSEFTALTTRELVLQPLGWWLGLGVLWRSCRAHSGSAAPAPGRDPARAALVFGIATAAFGGLYLVSGRFATFFLPFATLALFAELERRGRVLGRWTALPWRGRLPWAVAFAAAIAAGAPQTARMVGRMAGAEAAGIPLEAERQAFGASVPQGAKVAATWGSAEWYTFFAPQGRYLNVLDPIFMAIPYPEEYAAQRALFADREPDVPLVLATRLDSDFLALNRFESPRRLVDRLLVDPRMRLRYGGYHLLTQVVPDANRAFLLDWRLLPAAASLPATADSLAGAPVYPRAAGEAGRYEGYVDGRRLGVSGGCLAFARQEQAAEPTDLCLELAPAGPTRIWIDGEPRATLLQGVGAALGSGQLIEARLPAGDHTVTVESCVDRDSAQLGFYLLERRRRPADSAGEGPCDGVGVAPGAPARPLAGGRG